MPVGDVNVYTCDTCRGETVTVVVDDGVTSSTLTCRATSGCAGLARSSTYRPRPGHAPPAWEWYRPSPREVRLTSPAMRRHAELGGLFVRARV